MNSSNSKYEILSVIGEGSYGIVYKCHLKETNEFVAIKKFKDNSDHHSINKSMLRELKSLKIFSSHKNIINFRESFKKQGSYFFVFDYVEKNLLEFLSLHPNGLKETFLIKKILYQIFCALQQMHKMRVAHRDIKPENILIDEKNFEIKICDFGFARRLSPKGESQEKLTEYVATRWYRAPELLLGAQSYGLEIDLWAVGCIMGELIDGNPVFPGDSDLEQLYIIGKICGSGNCGMIKDLFFGCGSFSSNNGGSNNKNGGGNSSNNNNNNFGDLNKGGNDTHTNTNNNGNHINNKDSNGNRVNERNKHINNKDNDKNNADAETKISLNKEFSKSLKNKKEVAEKIEKTKYVNPINGSEILVNVSLETRYAGKISRDALSLMKRLLDPNPLTRINSEEIFKHEFFADFDLNVKENSDFNSNGNCCFSQNAKNKNNFVNGNLNNNIKKNLNNSDLNLDCLNNFVKNKDIYLLDEIEMSCKFNLIFLLFILNVPFGYFCY